MFQVKKIQEVQKNKEEEIKKLGFPAIENMKISTSTIIIKTNLQIDLFKISSNLIVSKYYLPEKKRGRKKKINKDNLNETISPGSIINIDYEGKIRGVSLKKKISGRKNFRNSCVIIIALDSKKNINIKVARNGTLHLTGCTQEDHPILCLKYFIEHLKKVDGLFNIKPCTSEKNNCECDYCKGVLRCLIIPIMCNIGLKINFNIDRDRLNKFINMKTTKYLSLLNDENDYMGGNIKTELKKNISELKIKEIFFNTQSETWSDIRLSYYEDYLKLLTEKEIKKKKKKKRYNTFLVFQSGNILMSGITPEYMKDDYYDFILTIINGREQIEEKLFE